ncbi:uncharacterized protein BDW43DRAFT_265256 [Aspergillus alliaceus]|uniref:uncharacterized protein n=1 Tax=Petromyces alliaceus TaxID=209559 RepID=UPI0012A6AA1C|nr:uncharacterized protein BDW43DRAFT_265256 [Aspergillus alliaceus]KAB8237346.1 hypothetical protein BDW43DRAFT_265256 [Aspergillus alliaceus]
MQYTHQQALIGLIGILGPALLSLFRRNGFQFRAHHVQTLLSLICTFISWRQRHQDTSYWLFFDA